MGYHTKGVLFYSTFIIELTADKYCRSLIAKFDVEELEVERQKR